MQIDLNKGINIFLFYSQCNLVYQHNSETGCAPRIYLDQTADVSARAYDHTSLSSGQPMVRKELKKLREGIFGIELIQMTSTRDQFKRFILITFTFDED